MSLAVLVFVIATLLTAVSLAEPLAARVKLPASVLLAIFGVAIGAAALFFQSGAFGETVRQGAETVAGLPLDSDAFLFIFLPLLLFQSSLNTDARQIVEDASPIFTLAIVAVVVSTFVIGFALAPFSAAPLVTCLLLGAIVATTDPIAVIGVFREAGAPGRLVRVVEGESLLNDAAAVTLFALFLDMLVSGRAFDPAATFLSGITLPLGGTLLGIVLGQLAASLIGRLRENALAPTSVSLGLPYLAFTLAEHWLHVSGVMAVVTAGVVFASAGPAKSPPEVWRHLRAVWDQLDWWAASLIFVLASILAPRLIADATPYDAFLLLVLILASFAARAIIVFGMIPGLSALGIGPRIERSFQWVIFWGGLRGATTLALALAVTEQEALSPEVRSFVATLSTGFVFFTLLVQGATLPGLVRRLGVDRLAGVDLALRLDVLSAARRRVATSVAEAARAHGLSPERAPVPEATPQPPSDLTEAAPEERAAIALATLARAEREIVMERVRERSISLQLIQRLLGDTRRLADRSRSEGAQGYVAASARTIEFSRGERFAHWMARRTAWSAPLRRSLSDRFEALLIASSSQARLASFPQESIAPVLGSAAAEEAQRALGLRRGAVDRALSALRLQYPDYAEALERRLLANAALRLEEKEYDRMLEDGLISPELHRDLQIGLGPQRRALDVRPPLDLGLDARALIQGLPMFVGLPGSAIEELVRIVEPVLARPGERLIRRGERGDAAYFISSGAVEVTGSEGQTFRLGRGDFFGEIALVTDNPRTADVDAIAYCSLLALKRRRFLAYLDQNPEIAATISATADERLKSISATEVEPATSARP